MPGGGGVVERLEGEVVGRTQVAAADLEDRVEGAVVERRAGGAGDRAAVGDVLRELLAREQAELGVVDAPAGHRLLLVAREQHAERGLPGDDEREHEPAVHVEVGEDAQHAEDVGAEFMTLVEQEHGAAPLLVRGGLEALLQAADEHRVRSRRARRHTRPRSRSTCRAWTGR